MGQGAVGRATGRWKSSADAPFALDMVHNPGRGLTWPPSRVDLLLHLKVGRHVRRGPVVPRSIGTLSSSQV